MQDAFLTIDELEDNTRRLAADPRVAISAIGASRAGRPIEMISIGQGARDALIVGVPHPNEPVGALTIERMIALLLSDTAEQRGYRWHFIKAIDPEGLRLNGGWLKKRRTIGNYLEHFFRPALHRQPETTFPLATSGLHFDASTPENLAWQRAFALTKPCMHASLHHCDFGGVFFSLSRALPAAIDGLEQAACSSGLAINSGAGGIMAMDQWSPAVSRYPSAPELAEQAKESGDAWAYPWTLGEMSPGFSEAKYGTFTIVPEIPMWRAVISDGEAASRVTRRVQHDMLSGLLARTNALATLYAQAFAACGLSPDAQEFLWAIEGSLKLISRQNTFCEKEKAEDHEYLTRHDFDELYSHQALHILRTQAYVLGLSRAVLTEQPDHALARKAEQDATHSIRREVALIEAHTTLVPVALDVMTGFQMQAIFTCADALAAQAEAAPGQ